MIVPFIVVSCLGAIKQTKALFLPSFYIFAVIYSYNIGYKEILDEYGRYFSWVINDGQLFTRNDFERGWLFSIPSKLFMNFFGASKEAVLVFFSLLSLLIKVETLKFYRRDTSLIAIFFVFYAVSLSFNVDWIQIRFGVALSFIPLMFFSALRGNWLLFSIVSIIAVSIHWVLILIVGVLALSFQANRMVFTLGSIGFGILGFFAPQFLKAQLDFLPNFVTVYWEMAPRDIPLKLSFQIILGFVGIFFLLVSKGEGKFSLNKYLLNSYCLLAMLGLSVFFVDTVPGRISGMLTMLEALILVELVGKRVFGVGFLMFCCLCLGALNIFAFGRYA